MGIIKALSPQIIAQIAAGEVIERPVYVVKELVENALDAASGSIHIAIEDSGLTRIRISDNGIGMSRDDVLESIKLHTTSKLSRQTDLLAIASLGFRGEALASIAAVSQLSIKSKRTKDSVGTQVDIAFGKDQSIKAVGMPTGTIVEVQQLFAHIPARKKFLKTPKTELRHILDWLTSFVLGYPNIEWAYTHNKKTIFHFPKTKDVTERIGVLLGLSIAEKLLPMTFEDSYLRIRGFIGHPQIAVAGNEKLFVFINDRVVNTTLVQHAIKEAYGILLEPNRYPMALLYLTLPHEMVDVNVHPRKEYVQFADSRFIFDAVVRATKDTLSSHNLTFSNLAWQENIVPTAQKLTKSFAGKLLKQQILDPSRVAGDIIQFHNLYLITQTHRGILIIDQHAAHERILYEQFTQAFLHQKASSKIVPLTPPVIFQCTLSQQATLEEYKQELATLGFTLEEFGIRTYKITAVPELLQDRDPATLITELLTDLTHEGKTKRVDLQSKKMLAYLACRSAVKAGDTLSQQQRQQLVKQLQSLSGAYTCPHGRPVQIEITLSQLHKLFKRT